MGDPDPKIDSTLRATSESVPTGHPPGFKFFFWGEFAERCSYYGMRAILLRYMAEEIGLGDAVAGTYFFMFIAACYLLPLVGGYLADNYFGKYWTIVGFSVPYVLAQFMVGIEDKWILLFALCLLAMGTGVIKPNISTLMGLTYDQQRPGQAKLRSDAFAWFYFSINLGSTLSMIVVPTIRDHYGYQWAFLFPAVFMAVALAIFASGKKYYAHEVLVRRQSTPEEVVTKLETLRRIAGLFGLVILFWAIFDQSSATWVFFARDYMDRNVFGWEVAPDQIQSLNPIFVVALIPIMRYVFKLLEARGIPVKPTGKMVAGFLTTAVCMGVMACAGFLAGQKETCLKLAFPEGEVLVERGERLRFNAGEQDEDGKVVFTDGRMPHLTVAQGTLNPGNGTIIFRDGVYEFPKGKLVFRGGHLDLNASLELFKGGPIDLGGGLRVQFRNGEYQTDAGKLVINKNSAELRPGESVPAKPASKEGGKKKASADSVSVAPAAFVRPENQVSILWMVVAFFAITVAEILISVTGLELAFVAAPKSMTGFVTACWLLTVFLANLCINTPSAWLWEAMNPGPYFLLFAIAGLVVTIVFIPVGRRFSEMMARKDAEEKRAALREAEAEGSPVPPGDTGAASPQ